MRLFVGIPLPMSAAAALDAVCRHFRPRMEGLRWATRDSWHITLEFLGAAGTEAFECVASSLGTIQFQPVSVLLQTPGVFDRAGIFFMGISLSPELAELQRRVVLSAARCGFVAEARDYQPHITLARGKGASARRSLRRLNGELLQMRKTADPQPLASFVANEFVLYESFTRPEGSRYEVRRRFPLAGGGL